MKKLSMPFRPAHSNKPDTSRKCRDAGLFVRGEGFDLATAFR